MKVILSPAKKLNFSKEELPIAHTEIFFSAEAEKLIQKLKKLNPESIAKLMNLSPALAELNHNRYQNWSLPFDINETKAAAFAFDGEVYSGLNIRDYSAKNLAYAQDNLVILSGLYGILKPFDLIMPYRLEMGTKLEISPKAKNLYQYWDKKLANQINKVLKKDEILVNLASEEYAKVLKLNSFLNPVVTPIFKENSPNGPKVVMVYAKQARGLMASFILKNEIKTKEELCSFTSANYTFNEAMSTKTELLFLR